MAILILLLELIKPLLKLTLPCISCYLKKALIIKRAGELKNSRSSSIEGREFHFTGISPCANKHGRLRRVG